MLSLKRLGYVLLIVLGICGIFTLYNINEKNNKTILISNNPIEESELLFAKDPISKEAEVHFYILGNPQKEMYGDIYQNTCQLMGDLKLSWSKIEKITEQELNNTNSVFIFCDDIVSEYVDLQQFAMFIQNGGKAVLAAGVAEGYQDVYLQPVLGITEKTIKENYNKYNVSKGFFPLQSDVMVYDGYNASTWMKVRNDAEIYMEDYEKEIPVVYAYAYGEGETLVINATMLSDSRNMGILAAGLGELLDEFVYPILGTECVFLDNFPIVTYVNDSVCMKLYGRTTEAFVRDVVWPVFQGLAVRNKIRYTSSVLSVSDEMETFPEISESLFNTLGKSALQYNGEMAYAVTCMKADGLHRNDNFINNFEETFQNYDIEALVMVNGQLNQDVLDTLNRDIKIVRGKLSEEKEENRMAILEQYAVFPEATSGRNLSDGNMLAITSILTSHGMVSHTFDVNHFITTNEEEASWDIDKIQLAEFEKQIFSKTDYLQEASLSETSNILKSYLGLNYCWEKVGNQIEIKADHIIAGQPFWVRTKDEIVKAEGAEYIKVADTYYCVRLKDTKAVLILE